MKTMMIAALVLVTSPLAVYYLSMHECWFQTERAMALTGYDRQYRVVDVCFEGIECGRIVTDSGSVDYGVWLLFRPKVVDMQTGQPALFHYDNRLRYTPDYGCTHAMAIFSWYAGNENDL
jgi:hypothetical protein